MFPYLQYVQKLSNHLSLIIPGASDNIDKRESDMAFMRDILPKDWERLTRRSPLANSADEELCGKWKVLKKLLKFWHRERSKVLVFSYSVRLLKMLNALMMV